MCPRNLAQEMSTTDGDEDEKRRDEGEETAGD